MKKIGNIGLFILVFVWLTLLGKKKNNFFNDRFLLYEWLKT